MQDRFKFRFWHKPTKKMVGCYGFNPDFVFGDTFDGIGTTYNPAKFDDCILMQCTGMKATDGQLLYEGDIIEYKANDYDEPEIAPIVWGDSLEYPAFDLSGKDFDGINGLSYIFAEGYKIKVIGNIYENPELLKGGDE